MRPADAFVQDFVCRTRLLEETPVFHSQIAFGRQVVGDEDVVAVELDMPIAHLIGLDLRDGSAIDQMPRLDHDFAAEIDADRMAGRNLQILRGAIGAESGGGDSHRIVTNPVEAPTEIEVAMTDPLDRPILAGGHGDEIARFQSFDGNIASRGADQRAAQEADKRRRESVLGK